MLNSVLSFNVFVNTQDWNFYFQKNIYNDEVLEYLLNNKNYKRHVNRHMGHMGQLFSYSQEYRNSAVVSYLKINELLNRKQNIPDHIYNLPNDEWANNFNSVKYQIIGKDGGGFHEEVEILVEKDNSIKMKLGKETVDLVYHSNDILYNYYSNFYVKFEKTDYSIFTLSYGIFGRARYEKKNEG